MVIRHGRIGEQFPEGTTLEAYRDGLYKRLELGYARIEQALAEGEDTTTWEDFWVALLREYERVCDQLQRDLAV